MRNRASRSSTATPAPAFARVRKTAENWAVSHWRREGMRSIIGITAMSWNSRIPNDSRPCTLSISSLSAYTFRTIAVLERETTKPTKIASGTGDPESARITRERRTVAKTCAPPAHKTCRRIFPRLESEISSPTVNRSRTTPISASASTIPFSETSPAPVGPMIAPATRNAATTERRSLLKRNATAVAIARTTARSRRMAENSKGTPLRAKRASSGRVYQRRGKFSNRPAPVRGIFFKVYRVACR